MSAVYTPHAHYPQTLFSLTHHNNPPPNPNRTQITPKQVTWAYIKTALQPVIQKVIEGKFQDPKAPAEQLTAYYAGVAHEVEQAFQTLSGP